MNEYAIHIHLQFTSHFHLYPVNFLEMLRDKEPNFADENTEEQCLHIQFVFQ